MQRTPVLLASLILSSLMLAPAAQAGPTGTKCHNETVYRTREVKDPHRVTGTVIGAVAGGLLGHQLGGGNGRDLATVGGAVAGGVVGHKIQRHHQDATRRSFASANEIKPALEYYPPRQKHRKTDGVGRRLAQAN